MECFNINASNCAMIAKSELIIPLHVKNIVITSPISPSFLVVNGISIIPHHALAVTFEGFFNDNVLIHDGVKIVPEGVKYIKFEHFDYYLVYGNMRLLPESLEVIIFSSNYNKSLRVNKINVFPENVREIRFGLHFDQFLVIDGIQCLPPKLETIYFGQLFNSPLMYIHNNTYVYAFPDSVKYIDFRNNEFYNNAKKSADGNYNIFSQFNQPVLFGEYSVFPINLECVYFGSSFNQPLTSGVYQALPKTVKKLGINGLYYGKIPLFDSIEYLIINEDSIQSQMRLNNLFDKSTILQNTTKIMTIEIIQSKNDYFQISSISKQRCMSRKSIISEYIKQMSRFIKHIHWKLYIHNVHIRYELCPYPENLYCTSFESLRLNNMIYEYGGIPQGVKTVNISCMLTVPLLNRIIKQKERRFIYDNEGRLIQNAKKPKLNLRPIAITKTIRILPNSIENVNFLGYRNDDMIKDSVCLLPKNVVSVSFSPLFNKDVLVNGATAFPDKIKRIIFGYWFNRPIISEGARAFQNGVEIIVFGSIFNQPIVEGSMSAFPNGVKEIYFGDTFNQPIINAFPDSLTKLYFSGNFNQHIMINNNSMIPQNLEKIKINADYLRQFECFPDSITEFLIIPQYDNQSFFPPYDAINEFRQLKGIQKEYPADIAKEKQKSLIESVFGYIGHKYIHTI